MGWVRHFFLSSPGRKFIMSGTGIFLMLFLIVHLLGNLQLLIDDEGEAFNIYAYTMSHHPLIRVVSLGLYAFIILHTIQGIVLAIRNRQARPKRYAVGHYPEATFLSKHMTLLGLLIFAFLCIHLGNFWYVMRFTDVLPVVEYEGFHHAVRDLSVRVYTTFSRGWIVVVYLVGLLALALHLWHGFESAFHTLGLTHKRFGFLFRWTGRAFSVIIPVGFAVIPLYIYFSR